jgi:hypothetical protein
MWMEIEEVEEEVFFVNVLQETGPNSDEEMEKEIEGTEAAVYDCLRRRARRAGVSMVGQWGSI